MNRISYLLFALMFVVTISRAQTATDFTSADCNSVNHNLFTELNSGKVIVLCWVMPCSACISTALSTSNVVQAYHTSNPGRVFFYLCDDLGNTACSTLTTWGINNSIAYDAAFSNSVINMSDYTGTGMPKVVVLGGASHTVFYDANNTIVVSALQNGINAALAATGINNPTLGFSALNVMPNPATNKASISFSLDKTSDIKIELFNINGQLVKTLFEGKAAQGDNTIQVNLASINSGIYFAKFSVGDKNKMLKVVVAN